MYVVDDMLAANDIVTPTANTINGEFNDTWVSTGAMASTLYKLYLSCTLRKAASKRA